MKGKKCEGLRFFKKRALAAHTRFGLEPMVNRILIEDGIINFVNCPQVKCPKADGKCHIVPAGTNGVTFPDYYYHPDEGH